MAQDYIDRQFDRAVEIVQGLPANGPIQTGYEEKLQMYSLYKQATVGNVTTPRPGIWDMLGRAKWDAWAKHKDLSPPEAKSLYVETLMKILRKYSNGTTARDLLQDLEEHGDPSSMVISGSLVRSDSGSESEDSVPPENYKSISQSADMDAVNPHSEPLTSEEETDQDHEPPLLPLTASEQPRSGSGMSSQNRYRTPATGSAIHVPIPSHVLSPTATPGLQPLPEHPAPSAYGNSSLPPTTNHPHSSLAQQFSGGSQRSNSPRQPFGPYRGASFQRTFGQSSILQQSSPATRPPIERAVESMQASLAALHERLESLENSLNFSGQGAGISNPSLPSYSDPSRRWNRISSPTNRQGAGSPWPVWDPADMGAWSFIIQPLSRLERNFKAFMQFLAHSDDRSPLLMIIRRLFLDLSFLFFVLFIAKSIWRRTRLRRGEVYIALRHVWRALTGNTVPRLTAERGV